MRDAVAVDAKRILLRYGAPITAMDRIPKETRITLARTVTRTPLHDREKRLRQLLIEGGFVKVKRP